ncbi:hypothetical protein [Aneurinibacillus uraniidurans]|uniref:hypothetical protein n=1 Tax=Aneurinibacillus uraniidurans TaxID=2966586 RepID=UPI00234BC423|nr:hypothetical protein [Aneurinibacillus sp. B1]WCN37835.1 hypothetical protein PO771_19260 [Aneurinibacillus sp. B1]
MKKWMVFLMFFLLIGLGVFVTWKVFYVPYYSNGFSYTSHVFESENIKQVSMVQGEQISVYDGKAWKPHFWAGVNLGATLPGSYPGDLAPSREDYLRWFQEMKEMNVQVVRIYTILPPVFYNTLCEFNQSQKEPLLFIQGIWSPEEELIGKTREGSDAYLPSIRNKFKKEIQDAVHVVHGDFSREKTPGQASGTYTVDTSPYLLGWIVGTEWYPYAVQKTNEAHPKQLPFRGDYFQGKSGASAFESWLAEMVDTLAVEEMKYGWQHPVAFANWLTTDPMPHPNEPLKQEDLAVVDPMHVTPTAKWKAGYFASYHAYSYYPDFLNYEQKYQTYKRKDGNVDPYAGYLHDLHQHHKGIPVFISEFGVPSSRGKAHNGPLNRNQGMHKETEQGKMDADMMRDIHDEGLNGAILFAWQDEWFKFTWNTIDLEEPGTRRAMWRNALTNEEHFGFIANEPGKKENAIYLDGEDADWNRREDKKTVSYPSFTLSVTHDEEFVYVEAKKKTGNWQPNDQLLLGIDSVEGGSNRIKGISSTFTKPIEYAVSVAGTKSGTFMVNSAFDYHTWLYVAQKKMLSGDVRQLSQEKEGVFLPWKVALSRGLYLPQSKVHIPFEEFEVGKMTFGVTDPDNPSFNNLSDWYVKGNILELRIPWMLIGFTDPSQKMAWGNLYKYNKIQPIPSPGISIMPVLNQSDAQPSPLFYTWKNWDQPNYYERKKKSYFIMQKEMEKYNE